MPRARSIRPTLCPDHELSILTTRTESVRTSHPAAGAWQQAMKTAVRDPIQLCRLLDLPTQYESGAAAAARQFSVFAPLEFIRRMRPGDPQDPLLRQVLPLDAELQQVSGFSQDAVQDAAATVGPGLIHKYAGRALMVTTGVCAAHCRYCFRRHFPYAELPSRDNAWQALVTSIQEDESIEEVILSGGDPLTIDDAQLEELVTRLSEIKHVRRLRVHTRLPVLIPQRVTAALVAWLRGTRLVPVVVVHINHPAEIDDAVSDALARLVDAGIPTLNQAVLLRGVNDNEEALVDLCRMLADRRVLPYYLHQLDRVEGAAHFEVPVRAGLQLIDRMRARLPGYAVPRYVQDVPGDAGKRVLA